MLLATAGSACGTQGVRPGLDVLLTDSVHLVHGKRVGVVTNQTGVDAAGTDAITRLGQSGVTLTAIFSPEHGFRGVLDVENIGHGVDSATGLPIFSLYGAVRAPTPEMLDLVDVLLVDLQDIGARTYTYVSTALRTLEAATLKGIPVIVLDRPNPVGGRLVQGPVLEPAFTSFVGALPVPLRHGMTMGELVRFGNDVLGIGGELSVVPASGWRRNQWFDATGLPWVRPSPSMPDVESATHYPGLVLFEATNLSVGRGTPVAFQVVAAPWLDAAGTAQALSGLPGVHVSDTTVMPRNPPDGKYPDRALPAVRFSVTDRDAYDPVVLAVHLLADLKRRHGDSLRVNAAAFDQRAGTDRLRRALEGGMEPEAIVAAWDDNLVAFMSNRTAYLIYP